MFKPFPALPACGIVLLAGAAGCGHQAAAGNSASGKGPLRFPDTRHPPTVARMQQLPEAHPAPGKATGL